MPSDYDRIRDDNIREYGEGTRHLSFLGRLYTDRTHFIFELLQNAEDAGASKVLFHLFNNKLAVFHNGRLFNEDDVRGICGVGEGTKAEDLTQIGKFGIGFKSVYSYTTAPEIYSGDESFRIENYVRPYAIEKRNIDDSWTTLFVFTFNKEEVQPAIACREISTRLRNLSARTLLFLHKIQEVEYILPDGVKGVYLRDEDHLGSSREVTVIGQSNGAEENEVWLLFGKSVNVPKSGDNDPSHVSVEIAFRLKKNEKSHQEEVARIKDSPLVVFFPTEKETRLGFLIQGPYRTTPSRDNIPKDNELNSTLIRETASLVAEVLPQLKNKGFLNVSLLEALPIRIDDFSSDSMFYPIVEAVRKAFLTKELLPADDGSFVSAGNAKLARGADLRKLLSQVQLGQLFQSTTTMKWLSGEITQDRTPDLRSYLISELDVEEVTPDGLARRISHAFLSDQPDEWFVDFYGYLSGQEALWRAPRWGRDPAGVLRSKHILRLANGRQEVPFKPDGTTPNAFLPPPEETAFPVVSRSIVTDEQARTFLKRLGLSEPDVFDDIVERVLPKYTKTDGDSVADTEHQADIQKIVRAMGSDSEAGKRKVIQAARRTPFLKATNPTGDTVFKKPAEIYLNTAELRRYFYSAQEVWFLHDQYTSSDIDVDIWHDLGVSRLPRKLPTSEGLPPEKREYSTGRHIVNNFDLDGLERFLAAIESENNFEEQAESASLLWKILGACLNEDQMLFKAKYQWFYYTDRQKNFDSMILDRLKHSKWVPTKEGTIEKPGDITTSQLMDKFLGATELIDSLGIVEGTEQSEDERKREHAKELGVSFEDIELMQNHRDEFEKWKSALAVCKKQPSFPSRLVANQERRQERLCEQLSDAPDKEYEKRQKSVRTTNGAIDPITWLRNQYTNEADQMVCQICKEEMPFRKRNGTHYFEKKEILSRDYLPKEYEAQYLALCPLCSAKYDEFIKTDNDVMAELREKIVRAEDCEIPISLGNEKTSIRFVETHYHDLKAIIEGAE